VITGTPGTTDTFSGTITASNGTAPDATQDFSIVIGPALVPEIAVEQPAGTDLLDGSASLDLGSIHVGSASSDFTFTVRNLGTGALSGLGIGKSGPNSSDFTVGSPGAATLTPGASTTFTVSFAPGGAGTRTAVIHLASNDADENPFDIELTGTGLAPVIAVEQPVGSSLTNSSASIHFGSIDIGSASGAFTFTVRNLGTTDLSGLLVSKNGANSGDFTVANPGTTNLTPGTSTTFTVTFTPGAAGARTAAIQLASNDPNNNPFNINLTGTCVAPEPPVVATGSPVAVSTTGATLVGVVNPQGLPTQVYFVYGLTTLYSSSTPLQGLTAGSGFQDVLAPITGLLANVTYHCKLIAVSAAGTTQGDDISFVATDSSDTGTGHPTAKPGVTTGAYADVTTSSAKLLGSVIPNGGTTMVRFEYGATTAYGNLTAQQSVGNDKVVAEVSQLAQGLQSGTDFHYRLSATNSLGTTVGEDAVFHSLFLPPTVVTGNANALSTTTVRVSGSVRARNATAAVTIEYGTNPANLTNSKTAAPASISGDATTQVSAELTNLAQGTTYYYQVRAETANPGGIGLGGIRSFDVGLLSGLLHQFPGEITAADRQGSVTVNLTPAGIGGLWRLAGERPWRASGSVASGLTIADRVIEYYQVPGYVEPVNETVVISMAAPAVVRDRAYTTAASTGSGGLTVILKPEALAGRAWRLLGESDAQWKDSGSTLTGKTPGDYVIECRAVAGRTTPPLVTAQVADGETTTATLTYFLAGDPVGAAPGSLSFDVVSTRQDRPYAYVGQITSNVGSGTGFVVRPRVVATAGHVVFDDGTLAATTGLQWFFQRDGGVHEPAPLTPRGFYLMAGYAAQRAADNSPGESSPNSQNLDAAALYFLTDAGRGGFSGYLASDLPVNEFVTSTALKTLVGYPIDGIAPANQGRMHATPLANVTFASAFGQTYTTSDIRSSGGGSGGPLCVQHTNGVWYPAAIYLGGTAQTVVRAIDGAVVDLFGFAESSAYASGDGTGGTGMQITTAISSPTTGAIQVVIEPAAARAAGAGWRVHAQQPYELSGTQINDLNPNSYTVQLATISGFLPPTPQTVALQVGQLTTLTFTYEKIILPPHITSSESVTGTRGQPLGYQIIASNSPDFFTQLGALPAGMSFNSEGPGRISGTPQEAGTFPVTVGATNAGGSDTKVVTLTVRPVLAAQAVTVPYQQPMSYPIVSSETGAGVTYANLATLPAGLALNAATGVITGTPTIPGVYSVPITVTRNGATSAAAILTLSITGTVPEITLEPVASMSIEYGLHATLIVAASGLPTPTDFQWYEGNRGVTTSPVTGATSSTFTTPVLTSGKSYWARVGNISGSADSQAAVISVVNSTNANLASLTPSAGTLSPAFNAGTLTYAAAVPYAVSTIRLTPKVQIAQSTVTINSAAVTAGVACDPLALVAGPNVFVIGVTAGNGNTKTYTLTVTRAQPPIATTEPATDVNDVAATLHGTVVPNSPVSARFEYGRTNSYGDVTSWQSVSGTAPVALQAALTNLAGDTTYHYRIIVMAGSEMFTGGDMAFTTSHARPLAVTGTPAYVNPTTQKLIGAVNPNGNETTVYFEYGPDATYGTNTTPQNFTAGFNVKDVFAEITGLTPDAWYHCRIVATSAGGLTSYGDDVLFQAIFRDGDGIVDAPPVVTIDAATDLTTTSAFLHGSVHPKEGTTIVHFEYGQTPDCDNSTFSEGIGNGNVVALVSIPVTGLLPDTLYYYRLVATNSLGTVTAPVLTDPPATFHTISLQLPPIVTTGNVVALSSTGVTLNGSVRAQGGNAEVWFDYGTDGVTFPDSVLAFQSPVTGDVETPVSADLTNLNGVLHYYFKVRATSLGGERTGDVASFQVGALRGLVQDFTREVAAGDRQGQVLVNLLPAGIGGWRFVGESQWRATGVAATGLTTSDRVIEYQAVPGYIQPMDETVVVDNERQPHVELTRNYYDSAGAGTGVLRVMLEPEAIAGPGVPEVSRAQWRLVAASGGAWMNSGAELSGLMAGSYLVECKPVSGKNTPPPTNVRVADGAHATASITYFPASAPNLNPPVVLPFATVSTSSNLPYAYVGQIRSGTGSHSGFVVKPRVVATAAQAVFDEATLAATNDIQWLLQRDRSTYEPDPQVPRGFYSFDSYAAQRSTEHTPGILSLESQNLNVAAIYFAEDAGRGGFSGFLASDAADNEFLKSTALKTLVGYPVNGIASANQGRMHATRPVNATFTLALGRTFTTPDIRGIGGMTGGPLCVQRDGGTYYPAGIHVGGITQGVVRAIDSGVIDLFTRAEISSNGGDNNTGGGITHSSFTSFGSSTLPGGIHVTITPAAVAASGMGGWQLKPKTFTYNDSGVELLGLAPSSASRIYTLQFKTVSGYKVPADQTVVILGGKTHEITFAYEPDLTPLEAWRMKYFGTKDPTGPAADDKDPDGDGQPNISEFAADTNPNNAADMFKVLTATKTATSYTVTAVGKAARTYTLERSTSLTAGSWTELGSVGPLAADGPVVLSDNHPPASSGFYRLRVTAP
jgi:phosphodiesterase/alkaline phosphatase D-like protein